MSYKATILKNEEKFTVDAPHLNMTIEGNTRDEAIQSFKNSLEAFSSQISYPVDLYIVDTGNTISIFGSDWKSQNNLDIISSVRTHPAFK